LFQIKSYFIYHIYLIPPSISVCDINTLHRVLYVLSGVIELVGLNAPRWLHVITLTFAPSASWQHQPDIVCFQSHRPH